MRTTPTNRNIKLRGLPERVRIDNGRVGQRFHVLNARQSHSWHAENRRHAEKSETVSQERRDGRASQRIPSRVTRVVRVLSVREEGQWLISMRDISLEGVGIYSRRPFPIGSILNLELPMRLGTVCRSASVKNLRQSSERGWIAGCCFTEPLAPGDIAVQLYHTEKSERRSKPRYSARHERGQCRVFSMTIEGPWDITVHDVSETGIGLISYRPFKAGMTLSVELPQLQEITSLRVVHSSKRQARWLVGCIFPRRISEYELRCLT